MKRKLIVAAVFGCLAVLLVSGAVFAEGETPPEAPSDETAVGTPVDMEPVPEPVAESATEPEEIPTGEELVVEVVEESEAVEVLPEVEGEATPLAETSDLVEALAAADVILADEDGEELNLASAETA